jgi:tight adherence protein C
MTISILLGLGLFVTLLALFLLMLSRPSAESVRLAEVTRDARGEDKWTPRLWRSLFSSELLAKPFTLVRKFFSPEPNPDLVRRLSLAGYRKPQHADIFLGARLALPVVLGVAAALVFEQNIIVFFFMALILGFFIPDFWLSYAINKRREKIKLSLPDGLDLLSICLEAGLGLDQGIVRSFVAMLIQTDRFGTPIAKSLGAFSDALRLQRRQQAEEMAAKTTIKMVPPLVFFIFPSMGVVVVGPAIITVGKSLAHIVK